MPRKADRDRNAKAALKARIASGRRKAMASTDVEWFIASYGPHAAPFEVLEGPPAMMIVRSAAPLSRAVKRILSACKPPGLMLYNVRMP